MHRAIRFGLLAAVAAIGVVSVAVRAQIGFSLAQITSYAFPSDMVASHTGSTVAWITTERGVRNVWIAQAPDFSPRALTHATSDDGQELTNLSFSGDGRFLVYTRGGDHGSNWPAEGNLQPDPTSSPVQPVVEVWAAPVAGGEPKRLAEGDNPVPSPDGSRVVFERARQLWVVPIDGSEPAERLFFARGSSGSPEWSPDGRLLAFVSNRGDHSFIAISSGLDEPLRYLAPSTARDSMPRWSPDGRRLAFVRRPGQGGPAGPLLDARPQPWAIWVAEIDTGTAREIWHSTATLRGSYPRTQGGANLNWAAGDRLVYLSYEDGWPHLYSVPATGGSPVNLTRGSFMVEYVTMAADRRSVVYNANTGDAAGDNDRRHLFKVPVDRAAPVALTRGDTIDWAPVVTADSATVAYFSATPRQPGQPMVMPLAGGTSREIAGSQQPTDFPASALVVPEPVTFQAPDGTTVHAQLFKSATGGAARRPAVVFVHGGPPRQMLLGWHYLYYYANSYAVNQYLASRGFIVLAVNYRLGIGYGYEFHQPERAGARGASEYQDVLAGGRYLQQRPDVDASRIGIWGGSYGGYLTALALGRNSDVFAAGVDMHGVHTRVSPIALDLLTAGIVGDGVTETDVKEALRVAWRSSPVSAVPTWRSPVLLIHGDDDRNVQFAQTVDLVQRLRARGVEFEELVFPDEIHDFLLYRTWLKADEATADFLERKLK